jgi:starch-binding outer membrane protein, SusD/RagB family
MKNKISIIAALLVIVVSCKKANFLDDKSNTALTEDAVFTDSVRTMAFLTRMYEEIGFAFNKNRWEGSGNTDQGTDDSEYTLSNPARRSVALGTGSYSPDNFGFTDMWQLPWVNIRRANLLLSKLPVTPLSVSMQQRVKGECKFMRAYFYAYMLINFGGVPLIGDKIFNKDDIINIPRSSFEDCVNYVVKELDEAAAILPLPAEYQNIDYGRITKGACMAIKARLLLHAASPLFNGGTIAAATTEQKKLAGYPDYNVSRWQAAADAANAVITSGQYSLYNEATPATPGTYPTSGYGFYKVFLYRTIPSGAINPEFILFVNRPANREWEQQANPGTRGGGKNLQPSNTLVEAFPMKNGKAITDPTSGYDPANPYANRDPRFDYTVIYNGSTYYSTTVNKRDTVWTYAPPLAGDPLANGNTADAYPASYTGYFSRKMCDADISANSSFNTTRGWPLLRYAEMLLSYAEAINETGQTALAYPKLIEIRTRAGILPGTDGMYGLKPGMTVDEMRQIIRVERHIELAFEGDTRWNDICRWKIAEVTNNGGTVKCMHITRVKNGPGGTSYVLPRKFTYAVEQSTRGNSVHNFRPAQYFFPIPLDEIRKMPALLQNPGW